MTEATSVSPQYTQSHEAPHKIMSMSIGGTMGQLGGTMPGLSSPVYAGMPPIPPAPVGPMIDERIVMSQKDKALKELDSRVKLALKQHEQMYLLQKSHILADHDRQMQLTKCTIEKEKQAALFDLEGQYQTNSRGLEQAAQQQRMQIEQTAMYLDIQAQQQTMVMEHNEREKKWTASIVSTQPQSTINQLPMAMPYSVPVSTPQQPVVISSTASYQPPAVGTTAGQAATFE